MDKPGAWKELPFGYRQKFLYVSGPGSLWVLGGEQHRRERKLFAPSFHARRFRDLGRDIQAVARHHTDEWQPGQELKVLETTMKISLDVILRLTFSAKVIIRTLWQLPRGKSADCHSCAGRNPLD